MKKPHKFMPITNGNSSYDYAIYCEYCGFLAWHANRSKNDSAQLEAKQGCPLNLENYGSAAIKGLTK